MCFFRSVTSWACGDMVAHAWIKFHHCRLSYNTTKSAMHHFIIVLLCFAMALLHPKFLQFVWMSLFLFLFFFWGGGVRHNVSLVKTKRSLCAKSAKCDTKKDTQSSWSLPNCCLGNCYIVIHDPDIQGRCLQDSFPMTRDHCTALCDFLPGALTSVNTFMNAVTGSNTRRRSQEMAPLLDKTEQQSPTQEQVGPGAVWLCSTISRTHFMSGAIGANVAKWCWAGSACDWPCQRGTYLFGKVIDHTPNMQRVGVWVHLRAKSALVRISLPAESAIVTMAPRMGQYHSAMLVLLGIKLNSTHIAWEIALWWQYLTTILPYPLGSLCAAWVGGLMMFIAFNVAFVLLEAKLMQQCTQVNQQYDTPSIQSFQSLAVWVHSATSRG